MDLAVYLRRLVKRSVPHSQHGDITQEQPGMVQALLRTPRTSLSGWRFEQEADQHANQLAAESTLSGRKRESRKAGSGGETLPDSVRAQFERHFGQDFSRVRIHTDQEAERSAAVMGANAYTLGDDVAFAKGMYAPESPAGRRLLAHELTHVAQQNAAGKHHTGKHGGAAVIPAPRGIQCDDHDSGGQYQLQMPGLRRPWWMQPQEPRLQLRLDPAIQAELALMRMRYVQRMLAPDFVRRSVFDLDPSTLLPSLPPDFMHTPTLPEPAPLVPAGRGPTTPRAATSGDLVRAIMAIPAVDSAITRLRTDAMSRVRRDWSRLSTGERVLLVSQGVLVGGGALAAVLSSEQSRTFVLNQLQGRNLPVPMVPGLSFQFNATGPDRRLFFTLDLSRLIAQ